MPVSSEIWAFQSSEASSGRNEMRKPPSSTSSTSCSGIGSVAPPRLRSSRTRFSPTSLSSTRHSSAVPASTSFCTCS